MRCTGIGLSCLGGCIGHILVAMSQYSWMRVVTLAAARSTLSVVVDLLVSKAVMLGPVCCVVVVAVSFPSRYRSIRFCVMGSMNGGWLLVVEFE